MYLNNILIKYLIYHKSHKKIDFVIYRRFYNLFKNN